MSGYESASPDEQDDVKSSIFKQIRSIHLLYNKVTANKRTYLHNMKDLVTANEGTGAGAGFSTGGGGDMVLVYMTRPSIPMSLISSVPSAATAA